MCECSRLVNVQTQAVWLNSIAVLFPALDFTRRFSILQVFDILMYLIYSGVSDCIVHSKAGRAEGESAARVLLHGSRLVGEAFVFVVSLCFLYVVYCGIFGKQTGCGRLGGVGAERTAPFVNFSFAVFFVSTSVTVANFVVLRQSIRAQ